MKTTTYRCGLDRCESCGSRRDTRGIGEYLKHDNGQETLISCSDCHRHSEITKRIEASSLAGLVPPDFEVVGTDWIIFIPTQKFWDRWRVNRNWMIAVGCDVYYIYRYQKATEKKHWRCQLTLSMLD